MNEKVSIEFTLKDVKNESTPDRVIYCVKFCEKYPSLWSFFAAVGSNTVTIYDIQDHEVEVVRHYVDESLRTTDEHGEVARENFYACTWASANVDEPVVVAGGKSGVVKVISTQDQPEVGVIHGHGGDIHELRTHPLDDGLVFSASKDLSVRLWNIRSLVCVAIFGGDQGHRRDVLSLDVHTLGNCMVSSSLDTSIKIWNLRAPQLVEAIRKSDEEQPAKRIFQPHMEQIPLFSTTQIHAGYVDSVRWVGDCVLSKSTNNRIVLWTPDAYRYKGASLILQEYTLQNANLWFIKLDVCIPLGIFAVGNMKGKVFVFPLGPDIPKKLLDVARMDGSTTERYQYEKSCQALNSGLQHPRLQTPVRQVSFSADSKYLVACLDDGSVMTWNVKTVPSLAPTNAAATSAAAQAAAFDGQRDEESDNFFDEEEFSLFSSVT